ncbi:MAG: hypothetical protein IIA17_12030, partial [candidate division Zixibacteria bacterium]|nr:hypothetical protein [candidate division Zixibacteria bacterium]
MKPRSFDDGKLIYDKSKTGRTGYTLPDLQSGEKEILAAIPAEFRRTEDAKL